MKEKKEKPGKFRGLKPGGKGPGRKPFGKKPPWAAGKPPSGDKPPWEGESPPRRPWSAGADEGPSGARPRHAEPKPNLLFGRHPVWEAVRAHRSQLAGYDRLMALSAEEQQAIFGTQTFYRALSFTTGGRAQESELFQDEAFQPVSLLEHNNSSAISEAARPAAPGIKAR